MSATNPAQDCSMPPSRNPRLCDFCRDPEELGKPLLRCVSCSRPYHSHCHLPSHCNLNRVLWSPVLYRWFDHDSRLFQMPPASLGVGAGAASSRPPEQTSSATARFAPTLPGSIARAMQCSADCTDQVVPGEIFCSLHVRMFGMVSAKSSRKTTPSSTSGPESQPPSRGEMDPLLSTHQDSKVPADVPRAPPPRATAITTNGAAPIPPAKNKAPTDVPQPPLPKAPTDVPRPPVPKPPTDVPRPPVPKPPADVPRAPPPRATSITTNGTAPIPPAKNKAPTNVPQPPVAKPPLPLKPGAHPKRYQANPELISIKKLIGEKEAQRAPPPRASASTMNGTAPIPPSKNKALQEHAPGRDRPIVRRKTVPKGDVQIQPSFGPSKHTASPSVVSSLTAVSASPLVPQPPVVPPQKDTQGDQNGQLLRKRPRLSPRPPPSPEHRLDSTAPLSAPQPPVGPTQKVTQGDQNGQPLRKRPRLSPSPRSPSPGHLLDSAAPLSAPQPPVVPPQKGTQGDQNGQPLRKRPRLSPRPRSPSPEHRLDSAASLGPGRPEAIKTARLAFPVGLPHEPNAKPPTTLKSNFIRPVLRKTAPTEPPAGILGGAPDSGDWFLASSSWGGSMNPNLQQPRGEGQNGHTGSKQKGALLELNDARQAQEMITFEEVTIETRDSFLDGWKTHVLSTPEPLRDRLYQQGVRIISEFWGSKAHVEGAERVAAAERVEAAERAETHNQALSRVAPFHDKRAAEQPDVRPSRESESDGPLTPKRAKPTNGTNGYPCPMPETESRGESGEPQELSSWPTDSAPAGLAKSLVNGGDQGNGTAFANMAKPPPLQPASQRQQHDVESSEFDRILYAQERAHKAFSKMSEPPPLQGPSQRQQPDLDLSEFDRLMYAQEGALSPPPEVCLVTTPTTSSTKAKSNGPDHPPQDEPLYLDIDPRIHWPQPHTESWLAKKRAEIEARGGRKANFGQAAQRLRQQRIAEEAVPLEDTLPGKIASNPTWVRILKRMKAMEEDGPAIGGTAAKGTGRGRRPALTKKQSSSLCAPVNGVSAPVVANGSLEEGVRASE